jgi:hypothetical protein
MKPRTLALLASFAVLGCTTAARAEEAIRAVRLEYTVDPAGARCPPERVFRDAVGGQVRFPNPFVNEAPVRLIVTIRYRSGHYYGRAELQGAREPWSHEVTPALRDCRTLIDVLSAYVISKLDPPGPPSKSHDTKPPDGPPQPGPPSNAPPAAPPPNPIPTPEQTPPKAIPARWWQLRGGLTANLAFFSAPSDVAFEGAADFGVRFGRWFSLSGEFRGLPPAESTFRLESPAAPAWQWKPPADGAATVSSYRLAGAIVPCFHWPLSTSRLKPTPLACAVIQGGRVFPTALGLEGDRAVYWAGGGRLAFELDLAKHVTARFGSDFLLVLHRLRIHVLGQQVWEAPAFSMAVGGGLVFPFP